MKRRTTAAVTAALAAAGLARADIVFSDTFDAENSGVGVLNYGSLSHWEIVSGTIDTIGNGFFDFYPGNGLYLDLDGSTGQGGTIRTSVVLAPGAYQLGFDLGGSARGDVNIVDLMVGSLASNTYTLAGSDPLATRTLDFTVSRAGSVPVTFTNRGGDNTGAILDNVTLTRVPATSTLALAGVGVLLTGVRSRRRPGEAL